MRFRVNLLGGLLLAVALVFAVADIARTLADGETRLTTLAEALAVLGLGAETAPGLSGGAVDLFAAASAWAASVGFGIAALLLLFLGRPSRRRRPGRFVR